MFPFTDRIRLRDCVVALTLSALFALACSDDPGSDPVNVTPATNETQRPGWVAGGVSALDPMRYPQNEFLYGRGASEGDSASDPYDSARLRAMRQVAESVAVRIASSFEREVSETLSAQGESQVKASAREFIESASELDLRGFEIIESWNDPISGDIYALGRIARNELVESEIRARLEEAWRRDPNMLFAMAMQEQRVGDLDGAAASLRESLALRPDDARVQLALGKLELEREHEDEALIHLGLACALAGDGAIGIEARKRAWTIAEGRVFADKPSTDSIRPLLSAWWMSDDQRARVLQAWYDAAVDEAAQRIAVKLTSLGASYLAYHVSADAARSDLSQNLLARFDDAMSVLGFGSLGEVSEERITTLKLIDQAEKSDDAITALIRFNFGQNLVIRAQDRDGATIDVAQVFLPPIDSPEAPSLRAAPLTLEVSMVAKDVLSERWYVVRDDEVLRSGQVFRINVRCSKNAWVYAVNFDSQGSLYVFTPAPGKSEPVPADSILSLPESYAPGYALDHATGEEETVVIASLQPIPGIEELLAAQSANQRLSSEQADKFEQAVKDAVLASERGVSGITSAPTHWLNPGSEKTFLSDRVSGFGRVVRRISFAHR